MTDAAFYRYAVVGRGRMGHALVAAIAQFAGPFGRGFDGEGFDVVILAVPDGQIAAAAHAVRHGVIVGHCSGAAGLDILAPHPAFSVHPLMTVTQSRATFAGAGGALAGSTPRAMGVAAWIAERLGLVAVEIADADRVAYHAAAAIASNFLITLEDAAETLLRTTGASREILLPLIRAAVENWGVQGAASLTGPIARGDDAVVQQHRDAISERVPELLGLFDELVAATKRMRDR